MNDCHISSRFFFSLVGWDFWYCGHYWPIVPAPDDGWWWLWRNWWNEDWKVLGKNLPQRHFVHHKSHMTRPWFWIRAAAVGSQRLTSWAMAPLFLSLKRHVIGMYEQKYWMRLMNIRIHGNVTYRGSVVQVAIFCKMNICIHHIRAQSLTLETVCGKVEVGEWIGHLGIL
jgi:hypothetical protein